MKEELKAPTASDYKMKEVAVPGVSPAPRSSVLSVCVWLLEGMCTCVHTCHSTCVEARGQVSGVSSPSTM